MSVFLGIDTSNYTTSVAAIDSTTGELFSEKKLLPVSKNMCGLRQSDAVFSHVKQISHVCENVLKKLNGSVDAIGYSAYPCDKENSYMPCFLVGKMIAETLSFAYKSKLYEFSHQRGHIISALYSVNKLDYIYKPFIALHVSGGTTDMLKITPDSEKIILAQLIGKSLDLKAGQAIDRVGVKLGLDFPCGVELEKLSLKSNKKFKIKTSVKGNDCSLSGIENKAQKMIEQNESPQDISEFCIESVCENISEMCENAKKQYPDLPFVFAGGVMSNKYIKDTLSNRFNGLFAEPYFSSDNAVGTAVLTKLSFERNIKDISGK